MKPLLLIVVFASTSAAHAGALMLTQPLEYQVIQRRSQDRGEISVQGTLTDIAADGATFETRLSIDGKAGDWQKWNAEIANNAFHGSLDVPAGGWYRLEVRMKHNKQVIAAAMVEHVGIGEVFVVAGQSNSANHGQEKQSTQTQRVSAFDGQRWRVAHDPQPGASGKGGSFMPPLGDALVRHFAVPVGFIACGLGGSSVREWLPHGVTFTIPPTVESRVIQLPDGKWQSNGTAYDMLVSRMKSAGPQCFRAVLWHQGESDANQKDPTRTLPGKYYREYMEHIIRDSRRELGWEAPWFVAQASYHLPGDEASPDIRAAQASLWQDDIALAGPDSDALKDDLRERDGQGVHFSGKGLREHAARWAEKIIPWIDQRLILSKP